MLKQRSEQPPLLNAQPFTSGSGVIRTGKRSGGEKGREGSGGTREMRRRGKWRKEEDEDKWRDPSTSFPPLLSSLGREVEGRSEGRGKREEKGWIETGRCQEETLKQTICRVIKSRISHLQHVGNIPTVGYLLKVRCNTTSYLPGLAHFRPSHTRLYVPAQVWSLSKMQVNKFHILHSKVNDMIIIGKN